MSTKYRSFNQNNAHMRINMKTDTCRKTSPQYIHMQHLVQLDHFHRPCVNSVIQILTCELSSGVRIETWLCCHTKLLLLQGPSFQCPVPQNVLQSPNTLDTRGEQRKIWRKQDEVDTAEAQCDSTLSTEHETLSGITQNKWRFLNFTTRRKVFDLIWW